MAIELKQALKELNVTLLTSDNETLSLNSNYVYIQVTAGATPKTITLPDPTLSDTRIISITKSDSGIGSVIVSGLINGESSLTLAHKNDNAPLRSNGIEWRLL